MKLVLFLISATAVAVVTSQLADETTQENVICAKCHCDAATKTIDCSNLRLTRMFDSNEWAALQGESYEILKLNGNLLESIDEPFPPLSFKTIDFGYNKICQIANASFANLNELEEINFENNKLRDHCLNSGIFKGLKHLTRLRLSFNNLRSPQYDLFESIDKLEELYIDNNKFNLGDDGLYALFYLKTLRVLDMSNIGARDLPSRITNNSLLINNLEVLKLDGNYFSEIPYALRHLQNLKELTLDRNPNIRNIYFSVISNLLKLEKLSMSHMSSLKEIGWGSLSGLESLKELRLTNNEQLTTIDPKAFASPDWETPKRLPKLRKLFLNDNNLTSLSIRTFTNWYNMEEIHLYGNPWDCNCDMQWIVDFLVPVMNSTTPELLKQMQCTQPQPLFGSKLVELNGNNTVLQCSHKFGPFQYFIDIFDHVECGDLQPVTEIAILTALVVGAVLGFFFGMPLGCVYKSCSRRCKERRERPRTPCCTETLFIDVMTVPAGWVHRCRNSEFVNNIRSTEWVNTIRNTDWVNKCRRPGHSRFTYERTPEAEDQDDEPILTAPTVQTV